MKRKADFGVGGQAVNAELDFDQVVVKVWGGNLSQREKHKRKHAEYFPPYPTKVPLWVEKTTTHYRATVH